MSAFSYWTKSPEEIFGELHSGPEGLSTDAAEKALEAHGPNLIESKEKVTPLSLFFSQFKNPIMLILLVAIIISAFLSDWIDSFIIALIVLGSALLSFFQEYSASNAAAKLKDQLAFTSQVVRDGKVLSLDTEKVVPGDVVLLSAGSLIPADGVVLEANDFFVNQAVLTGETFPVEKNVGTVPEDSSLQERSNVVFMGTNVRSGSAKVIITETGPKTAFGQIADQLRLRPPETEFEIGIRKLGILLTEVMLIMVVGIFFFNVLLNKSAIDSLLFSIALAVGLTPQLLPAIININLSKGSQAMAKQGVIVRRLDAIENFGSMDILCTDKTGTLTEGVVKLDGTLDYQGKNSEIVRLYAWLNASLQTGMSNPLDEAIITQGVPDRQEYQKHAEVPYDFIRKRLSIVVSDGQNQWSMISKGALEMVLEVCTQVYAEDSAQPLNQEVKDGILDLFQTYSEQGYRVLGVARREVKATELGFSVKDEEGMTFYGFLLFLDPPKTDVAKTIFDLASLGVQLKVITGDNKYVARHIGKMIGFDEAKILTGQELNQMSDEALWHEVESVRIFAEVDPNEKERIILALKKRNHVIGYMGDGINDAPSLNVADVGISVANAVDVARQAADLVLLKQDLGVLRDGILEGRKTFANTLKYVFMATSANFGNMFSMAGASLFLPFLPMLPKQILLINFLTDLPEMSIATDNVDQVVLDKPRRMDIKFIRRFMLVFGALSSVFDYATFGMLMLVMKANQATFQTGWFIESILSASIVVFAIRTRLPFSHSKPSRLMLLMTALVVSVTLALPYTSLGPILGFVPLPLHYLAMILGIVALYFLAAEAIKRWFYKMEDRRG